MTLAEDFLLLALHEEKGKPVVSVMYVECGLVGAVLGDLLIAGRIGLAGRKGDEVVVLDPTPLGTPEEDAVLARMVEEKPRRVQWWVNKLKSGLRRRLLERLVAQGVLREDHHRVLGFIPVTRHPEANPLPEQELRVRLTAVLNGASADAHTATLLAIVQASRMNRAIFPDLDKKEFKRRVEELHEGGEIGEAVKKAIQQLEGAMIAAVAAGGAAAASAGG
ncbi:GPP34 family phosphoprotein [Actinocorallia sp. B10E7]